MVDIHELLKRVMDRCRLNLPANEQAKLYLRENGITNERAYVALRCGIPDEALVNDLCDEERAALIAIGLHSRRGNTALNRSGILIPTFNPLEPEKPVGFIKQGYAQNKHSFVTEPRGIACAADCVQSSRIVIADAPLLAMRLMQVGVQGVVVAESVDVLPALKDWLASHEILLCVSRNEKVPAFKAALGRDISVLVISKAPSTEQRKVLGLPEVEIAPKVRASITPLLLRDLMEYAKAHLAEGTDCLKALGADDAEFIRAFNVGFLPVEFRSVLNAESRDALHGHRISKAVIVPAFDEAGAIVDLLAVHVERDRGQSNLFEKPAGLLAPRIATACDEVIVIDQFKEAAKLFSNGQRNVLLLRGVEDAENNAARLWASGVRAATVRVRRFGDAIAAALQKAGIDTSGEKSVAVEAVAGSAPAPEAALVPASMLQLMEHDRKREQAQFKAGELSYSVSVSLEGDSRLEVRLECAGKSHLDRFDLAVEAQRKRYAGSAAVKCSQPADVIDAQLVALLDEVRKLRETLLNPAAKSKPVVTLSDAERTEALALLKRPDLLECIGRDLEALGWVGESTSKRLLYLTAISRKLPQPLSAALISSSGAGKSMSIETIAELVPAEDLIHVSRLTDSSLYYHDRDALRHKLLVVDEADALTPEVLVSLRVLQTRGALSQTHVVRDQVSGGTTTHFIETRGPVAVLTSTAGKLEEQTLSRCFEIPIDESAAQTVRVLDAQRRLRADTEYQGASGRRSQILKRHHSLQRVLESKAVVIPFAGRIEFPSSSIKHRREQERFLNLIEASALLHQHQRLKQNNSAGDSFIVASIRDYETAVELAADLIGRAADELSQNGRDVLRAIQASKLEEFDNNDLHALHTEWTRHKVRAGVDELLKLDVLTTGKRSRPRKFVLIHSAAELLTAPAVRLLPASAIGDLATFGETGFANSKRVRAIG